LEIITALQKKGFKVGMVGDGVNDVLAMKTANLSIAMESGAVSLRM
jgi:cation-transporting ATPase E